MNAMRRTPGILLVLWMLGVGVGCGGGPIVSGGLGPFSPDKFQSVEITLDEFPVAVRAEVDAEAAGEGVMVTRVTRDVCDSDGRYDYDVTFTDESGEPRQRRYFQIGTPYTKRWGW